MSPVSRARLALIETPPNRAVTRLHQLVRQRDPLRATFRDTWDRIAAAPEADLERWAASSLALAHVNAGPACLVAFWGASAELVTELGLVGLAALGEAAAEICRHAGAHAALGALQTIGPALRSLPRPADLSLWARGLVRLAREAPDSVAAVSNRIETILQSCDGAGFEAFIAAGLKASGTDRGKRRRFFTLEDPFAWQVLERAAGTPGFSDLERPLAAFCTALWGRPPLLRGVGPSPGAPLPRRSSLVGELVRVPETFPGVPRETLPLLLRACVAHATAHLALAPVRFSLGTLKPLQVALVVLIEDARVEALAMRRFPGLRRLWAPFHVPPAGINSAPALLARLARALFDPDTMDDDGFVGKARALWAAEPSLDDPLLSRRIGGQLGHDLGQMRLSFNPRTYVIDPAYRDDGCGLLDIGDTAEAAAESAEVWVEAARANPQDGAGADHLEGTAPSSGRAREAHGGGGVVATYPEWDRGARIERANWASVREAIPLEGDAQGLNAALSAVPAMRTRIKRLVRNTKIGRTIQLKRQPEGPQLDLEAVVDAEIARRAGNTPSTRVYRLPQQRARDLSVMILIDASESTRDRLPGASATVLDIERLAVAELGEALEAFGVSFAVRGFGSAGRENVEVIRIKDFGERYGAAAKSRLAGLSPRLSTRLGTVLRHAGAEFQRVKSLRKLLLVLTDGEPSDIDVADPLDLVEDARRATHLLKRRGIDVFGVTLDPAEIGSGAAVFGRYRHMPVRRLEDLPARLAELYFRLARR
jgi:nitric oxide reductase NorD protein